MKKNLLIIGAGQFGQVTKEIAESTKNYDKIDFLDDGSDLAIDKIVNAKNYKNEYQCFVVAMGNPEKRKIIVETLEKKLNCLHFFHWNIFITVFRLLTVINNIVQKQEQKTDRLFIHPGMMKFQK